MLMKRSKSISIKYRVGIAFFALLLPVAIFLGVYVSSIISDLSKQVAQGGLATLKLYCTTMENEMHHAESFMIDTALNNSSFRALDQPMANSDAYLKELREKYKLDELVAGCTTDFEKVQAVTKWVNGLWEHDGDNKPEQTDTMYILDQVIEHGKQYRCVEYGEVIYGCLSSLGITARRIGLKTKDVETRKLGAGHVATEAYIKELDKWIFIDGQWGIIPMLDKEPMNAVEFARAIAEHEKNLNLLRIGSTYSDQSDKDYYRWIYEYLYYLDVNYYEWKEDGTVISTEVMLVPTGAKKPTIFQKEFPLDVDIYMESEQGFYPKRKE
jgi:hypothetical protein